MLRFFRFQSSDAVAVMSAGLLLVLLSGATAAAELPDFATLVEKNAPSIVEVSTTRSVNIRSTTRG